MRKQNVQVLALFDIDKTLISGSQVHEKAFSDAFKTVYGVDTSIDIINHRGMTDQQIIFEVLKKNRLNQKEIKSKIKECMEAVIDLFNKSIDDEKIVPLRGVEKLLDKLEKNNFLLGLVTGNLENIAWRKLKKAGINQYFKIGGFGNDDINRTNLVRLAIRKAKDKFMFESNNNVFLFGDAPQDMKAGKEAGIKTIGVTTGIYSKKDLLKCKPDYILRDLTDIKKILAIMSWKIEFSELTLNKIKDKKFEKLIPELYELQKIVENNPWHTKDSVFNHTLSVLRGLGKLLKKVNGKINSYLNKKIDNYSRKELLFLGALFHDIGKKETFKKENNITKCPKHEGKGAKKLKKIISRLDLSKREQKFVIQIVKNHNVFHELLDLPDKNLNRRYQKIKKRYPDILLGLILLSMADMLGSQLKNNKPDEFNFRIDFLKSKIHKF